MVAIQHGRERPVDGQRELLAELFRVGGAGFVGSHLCDLLLGDGFSVVAAILLMIGGVITLLLLPARCRSRSDASASAIGARMARRARLA